MSNSVPAHPRDRLKKKTKTLKYPKDSLKTKELQVARDNVSALMALPSPPPGCI